MTSHDNISSENYIPQQIEKKWQSIWKKDNQYITKEPQKGTKNF